MANRKISQLTALTTPAAGDYLPIVDISEAADADKNKRITIEELLRGAPNGTAAAPSIAFESDPDTGIYRPGANQLAISTSGTERMRLDSSGRLGLGTSSPSYTLDVDAGQNSSTLAHFGAISNRGLAISTSEAGGAYDAVVSLHSLLDNVNSGLALGTRDTTRLFIDGAGNVGIGTTSPSEPLEVAGNIFISTSQSYTKFLANNTGESGLLAIDADSNERAGINFQGVSSNQSTAITFSTSETASTMLERMRIDTDGNVGIGTTTVNTKVEILDSTSPTLRIGDGIRHVEVRGGSSSQQASIGTAYLGNFAFFTDNTERARIDSSGRLGLGTSSPGALLDITANNETSSNTLRFTDTDTGIQPNQQIGKIEFYSSDSNTPGASVKAYIGAFAESITPEAYLAFATDAKTGAPIERMRIDSSGKVGIGTVSPSDQLHVYTNQADNVIAKFENAHGLNGNLLQFVHGSGGANVAYLGHGGDTTGNLLILNAANSATTFFTNNTERVRIDSSGRLLVGTSSQSGGSLLQVNDDRIRIASSKTPASASDTGTAGEICWDSSYIYVCTATDTWKRAALSTW